jgi:ribosome-associated toxin RatA of RatAB toxin-antitoxin module
MKNLSLLLTASILLSACSKTVKEVNYVNEKGNPLNQSSTLSAKPDDLKLLRQLIDSKAPNLALAELLVKSMPMDQRDEVRSLLSDLSPEEASTLIETIEKDNRAVRNFYLYHEKNYGKELLNKSIYTDNEFQTTTYSIKDQLKLSVFTYVKNKALNNILSTYQKRANEISQELAQDIAIEIAESSPIEAKEIENSVRTDSQEEAIAKIAKAKVVLEKVDQYFKASYLNENEQYLVAIGAVLAGALYNELQDQNGFQNILKEAKKIHADIKAFKAKAKELALLVNTLEKHVQDTNNNLNELTQGLEGAGKDLGELYQEAKIGINNPSNIHSKRIADFLYNNVLRGKEVKPDGNNSSILSKQIRINSNITKSINAVGKISTNLSSIISTTQKFAEVLGIKPSKDLAKLLDKAQKVNHVVSTVTNVISGFATGGALGAFNALGSSPVLAMMGGGTGGPDYSARFDAIDRKLETILANQKKMLEMQQETMKMIKDLAIMIDEYHQNEMNALAELRDISLVNVELQKIQLNKEIRSCERMVNFQLSSFNSSHDFSISPTFGIQNLKLVSSKFNSNINSLNDIKRILNISGGNHFENCQYGISEVFGATLPTENPVLSIYASTENENLYSFQRKTYLPLLNFLTNYSKTANFDSMPLHIPMSGFESLNEKNVYIRHSSSMGMGGDSSLFEMNNLISVKSLERYLIQLLLLYPLLEVNKDVWESSFQNIIQTYLDNSNIGTNQNTMGNYYLSHALKLVQSAIAQEALLAGEPIMLHLHDNYINEILGNTVCDQTEFLDRTILGNDFLCSIRGNKLLLKNLLAFSLYKKDQAHNNFSIEYSKAYRTENLSTLAKLVHVKAESNKIIKKKHGFAYIVEDGSKSKVEIRLPSPEALLGGKLMYSENMIRLLMMQEAVLEAIEKVSPVDRNSQKQDLLKLMFIEA